MKKILTMLAALGVTGLCALPAHASPESDLKEFQGYFKKAFPAVKFDDFSIGLYGLPQFKEYRDQWEAINDFPPYEIGLAEGQAEWNTKFKNGKSFDDCVKQGVIKPAYTYPRWDKARQEIRTAELDINECLKVNGEKQYLIDKDGKPVDLGRSGKERANLANLTAAFYAKYKGKRVKPDVDFKDPGALAAYEEGKKFWWTRRGQLNFACSACHVENAGKILGGNQPLSTALGHPVGWPAFRLLWGQLETVHHRYATCNSQVRAKPLNHNGKEYRALQLYETYMSSGLPLMAPSMRN